jgi:putative nucleotidyltransferase with HDIG domain
VTTATIDTAPAAALESPSVSVLCVDDEANILSALRRVFRGDFKAHFATSAQDGLAILEQVQVDLVISDMRMPQTNGAEFLEQVYQRWPDTFRVLLTGFSELGSAIEAVNRGRIHRYLGKPWQEQDLLAVADEVRAQKALRQENAKLHRLLQQQNEELETRVRERTQELSQTVAFLDMSQDKLKKTLVMTMQLFSKVIDMRQAQLADHSKRVAELARRMAAKMKMNETESQNVLFAALLHDIGLIGMPDHLLGKPYTGMTGEERGVFMRHATCGAALLDELEMLKGAAVLVRHHHEYFDGSGYPDGLSGLAIPLGARILAVANDYLDLQRGQLTAKPMREPEARSLILEMSGKHYDPMVVNAFQEILKGLPPIPMPVRDIQVSAKHLRRGMVLARDVVTNGGVLLLSRGITMTDSTIQQLIEYEKLDPQPLNILVKETVEN